MRLGMAEDNNIFTSVQPLRRSASSGSGEISLAEDEPGVSKDDRRFEKRKGAVEASRLLFQSIFWIGFSAFGWYFPRFLIHRETSIVQMQPPYQTTKNGDVILDFLLNESLVNPPTVDSMLLRSTAMYLPFIFLVLHSWSVCPRSYEGVTIIIGCPSREVRFVLVSTVVSAFCMAIGLSEGCTVMIKLWVQRKRPNFYALCGFDVSTKQCTADVDHIREANFSFPSGHSSLICCGMTFLVWYLHGHSNTNASSSRLRSLVLITWLPWGWALFVAASRLVDHWHHPSDIVAGLGLGFVTCTVAYHHWYAPIWSVYSGLPRSMLPSGALPSKGKRRTKQGQKSGLAPSLTTALMLPVLLLLLLECPSAIAWSPQLSLSALMAQMRPNSVYRPIITARMVTDRNTDDVDSLLSDLDARVLQSLLQDNANKLDLQQEENMKKLLERGMKSKNKVESPATQKVEEASDYSSTVIKTLADTKLWKALSRTVQDFVESAGIAIANRVERDAKLVASLGIFALDRALQDVSRALPAATSFTKKQNLLQLSDKSSYQETKPDLKEVDLRKEFSTPQDELKSVTAEIKQIFEQADRRVKKVSPRSISSPSSSSLKSTARRGTARLSQAYERQQKTKLAREKENIAQSSTRLASNVIDSAYQVKRELQVEPNQPGYKTKRLREATSSTVNLMVSAAKAGASTLLLGQGGKKEDGRNVVLPSSSARATSSASVSVPPTVVEAGSHTANGARPSQLDRCKDATEVAPDAVFFATLDSKERPTTPASPRPGIKADPFDFSDYEPFFAFKREAPAARGSTVSSSNVPPNGGSGTDRTSKLVDTTLGEGQDSSNKKALRGAVNAVVVPETDDVIEGTDAAASNASEVFIDAERVPAGYYHTDYGCAEDFTFLQNKEAEATHQVFAEIVSEEEFETVFGQAKAVDNLGDFEDEIKQPNLLVSLTLRSLDVLFLVVEKTVLLIPDILSLTTRIAGRVAEVNRGGMGTAKWQPLNTKIRGSKRY